MMQNNPQEFTFTDNREQAFDVKAFLWGYLRYWYWFVLSLLLCGFGAWLYLRYTVPEYEAYSKLLIKESGSEQALSEEAVLEDLGLLNGKSNVANEVEILKSRSLMLEVVNNLSLYVRYYAVGNVIETELYGSSIPFVVDTAGLDIERLKGKRLEVMFTQADRFKVIKGEEELGEYGFDEWIIVDDAGFKLQQQRKVKTEGNPLLFAVVFGDPVSTARYYSNKIALRSVTDQASVLRLSLVDYNGAKAVAILDELIAVYNQATIDDKNRVGNNTLEFIGERLEFLTAELAAVEGDVERYKSNNDIPLELDARAQEVLTRVTEYETEIAAFEVQERMGDELLAKIRDPEATYELLPLSLDTEQGILNQQIEEYNDLVLRREQLLNSAGEENPIRLTLEGQLRDVRQNIIANLKSFLNNLKLSKERVEVKYRDLRSALRNLPRAERELLEKKRQQIIKENLFLYLLQKREETALSLAVTVPNSRIVDPAESTTGPVSPVPFNIMAIAVFLGLSLPIGGILLRQILDDKLRTEKDVTAYSEVPVLGSISQSNTENKVVVSKSSRTGVAETFRLIRTNLRFMLGAEDKPVFLVTSTVSGEGKTFVSVNLGMSMAISNKRTLLIGLDLRKPKMGVYLDTEDTAYGITNYIVDATVSPQEVIRNSGLNEQLDFVTSGPIPPNPAELIMSERMRDFLTYARTHYDMVIIDTPPVGLVADAFLLSESVTNSIYVLRAGKTPKSAVEHLDRLYQQQKLNNMSAVVNGVTEGGGYGYGGYGYGYGGYGYGYYSEEKQRRRWWRFW